jgi:hypothetical protein
MIGITGETVTGTFAELKKRQLSQVKGATLHIRNKATLRMSIGWGCSSAPAMSGENTQDSR